MGRTLHGAVPHSPLLLLLAVLVLLPVLLCPAGEGALDITRINPQTIGPWAWAKVMWERQKVQLHRQTTKAAVQTMVVISEDDDRGGSGGRRGRGGVLGDYDRDTLDEVEAENDLPIITDETEDELDMELDELDLKLDELDGDVEGGVEIIEKIVTPRDAKSLPDLVINKQPIKTKKCT